MQAAYNQKLQEKSSQDTVIQRCSEKLEMRSAELALQKQQFREYETEYYTLVQKTVVAYEKYLDNGKKGNGGLLAEETRKRVQREIEQHKKERMQKQAD